MSAGSRVPAGVRRHGTGPALTPRGLQAGGLGLLGVGLPDLLRARAAGPAPAGRAESCILLYMSGGPSHIDTLDPKPGAPSNIRGEFASIATAVPGVHLAEHLPMTARALRHATLIRSVTHHLSNHNPAAQFTLSGRPPATDNFEVTAGPNDFPALGSVAARLRPSPKELPSYVQLLGLVNDDVVAPGQFGGFLGPAYNPYVVRADPSVADIDVPELGLPAELAGRRLDDRRALLRTFDAQAAAIEARASATPLGPFYETAYDLLTSPAAKAAFDIGREDPRLRDRYGRSANGQAVLLARRLVEAGVRFVTVNMGAVLDETWDTHSDNFHVLRDKLCPVADRFVSALLVDLDARGLLSTTLVVWAGEFGRTPHIGLQTGDNGTDKNGRDHWPQCYSVLLAGGPIRGGQVYGTSDKIGAYPKDDPVTPADLAATIFRALGLDHRRTILDRKGRPLAISQGRPLDALLTAL